jgi:hypothetical protein
MAINVPIISQFNSKGIDDAKKKFKELETPGQKAGFALKKAFVPATAALGGLVAMGVNFTKVAMEDQKSAEMLAGQLRRTTGATDDQVSSVEKYIAKTELAAAVADTELRPAFGKLVTATRDVDEAQKLMNLALDISAATGKPLEGVTDALSKAYAGNSSALQKLDPSLRDVIKSGANFHEIGEDLANTFGGAAAEAAGTAEGQFKVFALQIDNAKESIGMLILPIVMQLLPHLLSLADFLANNTTLFAVIGGVIGVVAGAIVVLNIAMKAYLAVQKLVTIAVGLFNAIMNMNPIMLVVLAVMALIAIFILLQKRFDIVGKAMNVMRDIFTKAKDIVLGAWESVSDFFKRVPSMLKDLGTAVFNALTAPYRKAFNLISELWNKTIGGFSISIPSWVPIIGGKSFGFPQMPTIPALAEGGIVTRPTLALVGEAGPEAVIPLNRAMGGGMGVTVIVEGSVISEGDLIEKVRQGLVESQRGGRRLIA